MSQTIDRRRLGEVISSTPRLYKLEGQQLAYICMYVKSSFFDYSSSRGTAYRRQYFLFYETHIDIFYRLVYNYNKLKGFITLEAELCPSSALVFWLLLLVKQITAISDWLKQFMMFITARQKIDKQLYTLRITGNATV